MLSNVSPPGPDDLIGWSLSWSDDSPSPQPNYVWIAHKSLSPQDCRHVVIYIHGGGFAKGDLAAYLHACSNFSRELHSLVAFPLYGLCPERSIDLAVDEIRACYHQVQDLLAGTDIVVMADSAGGFLATRLLHTLHRQGTALPHDLVLLSPLLNLRRSTSAGGPSAAFDPLLSWELLQWLCLLATDHVDPNVAMLDDISTACFPKTYIVAAADELLTIDSRQLNATLRKSNVPVRAVCWPKMFHAFPLLYDYVPEAVKAINDVKAWLDDSKR